MTLGRSDLPDQTGQSWLLLVLFAFVADLVVSKNNATTRVLAAVSFQSGVNVFGPTVCWSHPAVEKSAKCRSPESKFRMFSDFAFSALTVQQFVDCVLTNSSGDRDNLMEHVLACREEHDLGRSCTV